CAFTAGSVTTKNFHGCSPKLEGVRTRDCSRAAQVSGDLEGRVELLGGVAPLQLIDDGIGGRGWHGVRRSGRETQNTYRDRFASNESSTPAQVPPLSALPRQSGRPGPEQSSMGQGDSTYAF